MYYYILESAQSRAVRQQYQRLRDILTNLGIVGEIVVASPARTPEELTVMGIEKGYSTIVAVGGDYHINAVAASLIGRSVLGIIPINAGREITELIGVSELRGAAESLKHRRLSEVSTVLIEPDIPIFLQARIYSAKLAKISLVIDNKLRAYTYFNELIVNRALEIFLASEHRVEKKKLWGIFTVGGDVIRSESLFHARSLKIVTDPELTMTIAGQQIATTPLQLRLVPNSLKIITKRGTII